MHWLHPQFDATDAEIRDRRAQALKAHKLNVGDFVRFSDDVVRRVSYIWPDEDGRPESVQTSDGGSFYLGNGFVSFSGSLHHGVPFDSFVDTGDTFDGDVWIFHHDIPGAGCGVNTTIKFKIWRCNLPAEEC